MDRMEENIRRLGGLRPPFGDLAPMPEEEIVVLERSLGAQLPGDYRGFLAKYGASAFERFIAFRPAIPFPSHLSRLNIGVVNLFYGAAAHDIYGLAEAIDTHRDRMPETMIPIGDTGMLDQICIGITGPQRGRIYYWDSSEEADEEDYTSQGLPVPPDLKFQNVHLIADSFEEFLDRLYVREDG